MPKESINTFWAKHLTVRSGLIRCEIYIYDKLSIVGNGIFKLEEYCPVYLLHAKNTCFIWHANVF